MASLDNGTTDLWFDVAGAGPAVVLLHSGLSDSRSWDVIRDRLAEAHLVVRYDARGFGRSPDAVAEYDPVQDLAQVMLSAGVETAHLVGNSMGATLARITAIVRPESVNSLTLVGPGFPVGEPPQESVARGEGWRAARAEGDIEAALAVARQRWIRGPDQEARLRELLERQATSSPFDFVRRDDEFEQRVNQVEKLGVATLIIVGEDDEQLVTAAGRELAARIPGATFVSIRDAHHHPHEDQPVRFLEAMVSFLRSHRATQ